MNFFWHFFWQIALFRGLLENPPLNINGLNNGSRGRARRLFPIYFEEKYSVFPFGIKLILQNQCLL